MKSQHEILQMIGTYLSEDGLVCPLEIKSEYDTFQSGECPKHSYVDNGRADIVTERFESPVQYEGNTIVGYTLIDKYLYGRENGTWKKYSVTLYKSK